MSVKQSFSFSGDLHSLLRFCLPQFYHFKDRNNENH